MNVYYNTTFKGHWPVGTSAIVVAKNEFDAAFMLNKVLEDQGLKQRTPISSVDMVRVETDHPVAVIINNGDY